MSAMPMHLRSHQEPFQRDAELRAEQGYADWAYGLLEGMLVAAVGRENVAGDAATFRALNQFQAQRVKEVRIALADQSGLVIGRLDMVEDGTWYIGRHPVDGEGDRPAVVDWRAPFAEKFYQANRTFHAGIGRRRTIRMSARKVTGLSDEVLIASFVAPAVAPAVAEPPPTVRRRARQVVERLRPAAPPVKAERVVVAAPAGLEEVSGEKMLAADGNDLRAPDLLLDDLARERTGAMADIVATIQADQDRLVRAAPDVPLIIQGGPGTGKTVVGLHRAAWVLYQHRGSLVEESVLVVGPNQAFLDYIGSVLPSLGESQAHQTTIDDLALDTFSGVDRRRIKVLGEDPRAVARIKGDARMATLVEAAVWSVAAPRPIQFGYGSFTLRLSAERVGEIIVDLRRRGTPYGVARKKLAKVVPQALAEEYVRRHGRQRYRVDTTDLKQLMAAAAAELSSSGVLAKMLPIQEPRAVIHNLLESPALMELAGRALTAKERTLLIRPTSSRLGPHWTASDLPLLDEAAACIRAQAAVFGHVVVDEAQDLSPMHWRVVRRRTQRGSMTILGDLAQATSPWSPRSWAEVMRHANLAGKAEVAELRLGYRVPKQVMDFARPLLDRAAPAVEVPKSFRSTVDPVVRRCLVDSIPRTTHDLVVEHLNRGAVAVIAPSELHGDLAHDLEAFGEQVTLLVPEGAKGLEFDVVVVIEPATIAGRTLSGLRSLYICLTRATKELIVLHAKPLPPSLSAGRPITVPSTYPNLRNGDPWDNDAAYWLLDQDGGEAWTHLVLFECLRQQPNQRRRNPQRVKEAAQLAQRHGVIQERQAYGRRTIVRLYRTDREAPTYPGDEAERRQHRS